MKLNSLINSENIEKISTYVVGVFLILMFVFNKGFAYFHFWVGPIPLFVTEAVLVLLSIFWLLSSWRSKKLLFPRDKAFLIPLMVFLGVGLLSLFPLFQLDKHAVIQSLKRSALCYYGLFAFLVYTLIVKEKSIAKIFELMFYGSVAATLINFLARVIPFPEWWPVNVGIANTSAMAFCAFYSVFVGPRKKHSKFYLFTGSLALASIFFTSIRSVYVSVVVIGLFALFIFRKFEHPSSVRKRILHFAGVTFLIFCLFLFFFGPPTVLSRYSFLKGMTGQVRFSLGKLFVRPEKKPEASVKKSTLEKLPEEKPKEVAAVQKKVEEKKPPPAPSPSKPPVKKPPMEKPKEVAAVQKKVEEKKPPPAPSPSKPPVKKPPMEKPKEVAAVQKKVEEKKPPPAPSPSKPPVKKPPVEKPKKVAAAQKKVEEKKLPPVPSPSEKAVSVDKKSNPIEKKKRPFNLEGLFGQSGNVLWRAKVWTEVLERGFREHLFFGYGVHRPLVIYSVSPYKDPDRIKEAMVKLRTNYDFVSRITNEDKKPTDDVLPSFPLSLTQEEQKESYYSQYWYDIDLHNSHLAIFYRFGLIGFAMYFLLLKLVYKRIGLKRDNSQGYPITMLFILLWYMLAGVFNVVLEGPFMGAVFWIILGLTFSTTSPRMDETHS